MTVATDLFCQRLVMRVQLPAEIIEGHVHAIFTENSVCVTLFLLFYV